MVYMGSKSRVAKYIVPIIQQCIDENNLSVYIEPFAGGMNVVDKIKAPFRIASDKNKYLIALFQHLQNGGELLSEVSKELYSEVRADYKTKEYEDWYVGNIGFLASYNGRWFDGGYAKPGYEKTKYGQRYRDYYREAKNNILAQMPNLKDVVFEARDYKEIEVKSCSMIYCDPPYANAKQFENSRDFDYAEFWEIMRNWSKDNFVLISELEAPDDFICVWSKDVQRSIKSTDNTMRATEKLFTYKDGKYADYIKESCNAT